MATGQSCGFSCINIARLRLLAVFAHFSVGYNLPAAAQLGAPYRAGVEIIQPGRQPQMLIQATALLVISNDSQRPSSQTSARACIAMLPSVIAVNIAADVARRDLQRAAAGQKNMGMIRHTLRAGEGVGGGVLHLGRAGGVWHS